MYINIIHSIRYVFSLPDLLVVVAPCTEMAPTGTPVVTLLFPRPFAHNVIKTDVPYLTQVHTTPVIYLIDMTIILGVLKIT